MAKIETYCKNCGSAILLSRSQIRIERGNFCSTSCYGKWQSVNIKGPKVATYLGSLITSTCRICGERFKIYKRQVERGHGLFCSHKCYGAYKRSLIGRKANNWRGGKINKKCATCGDTFRSHIYRKEVSRFCSRGCYWKWKEHNSFNENNPAWRGGVTQDNVAIRGLKKSSTWRRKVFERDGYKCIKCGDATGGNLVAHHVVRFHYIVKDVKRLYPLTEIKKAAIHHKPLWDISNGITLCKSCHKEEHNK